MSKREYYKRTIIFLLASLVIIAQALVFAYLWYNYYRELIYKPFWRRGNWVLVGMYALIDVMFSKLYGGLRVGYLGYDLYQCGGLFPDYVDQSVVSVPNASSDLYSSGFCDYCSLDIRVPVHLFPSVQGQEAVGDLRRAGTG